MFTYRRVLLGLCILLSSISAANAAKARTAPGSFLSKPAGDVNAMCYNILTDKIVAARFSKHYGMPASDIISYYKQNLKVSTLKKSQRYSEYFIATTGRIQVRRKMLTAGTKVYVTFNGQPIIDQKCGNPLTKTLPTPPVVKVIPLVEETPPPVEVPIAVITQPAPTPAPEPVVEVLAMPPMELTSMVTASAQTSLLSQAIAGAGAIGVLGKKSEQPVPEPASVITLCVGGASLLLARFRARRRR